MPANAPTIPDATAGRCISSDWKNESEPDREFLKKSDNKSEETVIITVKISPQINGDVPAFFEVKKPPANEASAAHSIESEKTIESGSALAYATAVATAVAIRPTAR